MRSESDRKIIPAKTENTSTYLHGFKEFTSKRPRIPGGSPDLTEKRILAAAETVFSRDGFQGATTHEIAQQAGVNEVTIFRHFHTREELLGATLEHGCAEFDELIQSEEIRKGELAEGLERYVREMYSAVKQHEAIVRAFIGEARLPGSMRRAVHGFMLTRKARFVTALQEAQKLGLVRTDLDLSAAADFIRDSIHIAVLQHSLYRTDPETVDAHLRGVTDIFYRGIEAQAALSSSLTDCRPA
jgi:AcrR family transcriptional regulator